MMTGSAHSSAAATASDRDAYRPIFPFATLKATGHPLFRSQEARDYACLMDLDPEVVSWQSLTSTAAAGVRHCRLRVDFLVQTVTERLLVEVLPLGAEASDLDGEIPMIAGYRHLLVRFSELNAIRVSNARDLVRYARYEAALGDRIRVLAALDEMGSLTLAECLSAVREGRPMDTVASMILRAHIEVDIDENLLGPDTTVRHPAK